MARAVLESIGAEGQPTRRYYQRRLPGDSSRDYYFIHRLTGNTQPLLVEYGFIDTPSDLVRLQNNILDYAEAVVRAVANYAGVAYVAPNGSGGPTLNTYVVSRGDSLWKIANQFNVTVDELKQANNLTSNLLDVGQVLIIPIKQSSTIPSVPNGSGTIYIVQSGDTLYGIASRFNVSVSDIIDANELPTTVLTVGQQLRIPITNGNVSDTTSYTVQSGDSLWKIANRFGVTVDEIVNLNNLTSTMLQIGDILLIPGTGNSTIEPPTPDNEIGENGDITYVVQSGDSLYSIAKKFNTTVNALKTANNFTSNLLSIGQTLVIPTNSSYINYYVKSGDNLYNIARVYNTTVDEIRRLNNLTSDTLSINQLLLIPA